ncbi:MAG TPA: SCO family protein [Chitinophagaceae bacterium]
MNKKAFFGILIAILIPVTGYLIVKYTSERATVIPRRYYVDDVFEGVKDGKRFSDTVWHRTANFRLVNQFGDTVELYDLQNKIAVVDFIFTRCPSICPPMTKNMRKLQSSFATHKAGRQVIDSSIVQFISISIDPERDSPRALKAFADRFGVNHDNWWFLTGNKQEIYDFALNEMKLGLVDGEGVDTAFIHTPRFVVLDKNFLVRGYYDGLDSTALGQLAHDVGLLMLEKDQKAESTVFTSILSLSWLWLIVIFMVIVFVLYLRKRRKITEASKN